MSETVRRGIFTATKYAGPVHSSVHEDSDRLRVRVEYLKGPLGPSSWELSHMEAIDLRSVLYELLGNDSGVELVKRFRRDAENPARDHHAGIDMLRSWLRRLHMDMTSGWGQDTSQDELAELLGEYPRGHERAFMVR